MQHSEIMSSEQARYRWLHQLHQYGVCVVRNTPTEDKYVLSVAKKMGNIRDTIYGAHFDVVSVQNAHNVAYTQQTLRPHMDLLYYEEPPGFQFLHCLVNDATGGENTLVDGFKVVSELKRLHPDAFDILRTVKYTFHFRDAVNHMYYRRSMIELDNQGEVVGFNYSPPFEGPLDIAFHMVEPFYASYARVIKLVNNPDLQFRHRSDPGDLLVFNNRRILHARESFIGRRHLQGTYVATTDFFSTYRQLSTAL
eukprot:TRINITY_DN6410_c0_g1_i3.p1 TRINITY_DN6410_c0_g1~~TRINITY_DN6410_c0_g1_i3.p1  ORF type:complete len:252 (-),score=29.40 TRINITY_DN6410_c0_g1_i3:107-862(-)